MVTFTAQSQISFNDGLESNLLAWITGTPNGGSASFQHGISSFCMTSKILYYSFLVSFAGFLFGFDSVVISGANLPIKELWQTSDWFHGTFIMSSSLWGTVIGALFGGYPTEKFGRKNTLIIIGILLTVSAIGAALAPEPFSFSFLRFIGGVGAGISSITATAYISEISSASNRGKLGMLFQVNLVFGILVALLSNYFLKEVAGQHAWRWMLGVEFPPALIFTILMFKIPESPRWVLIHKKDKIQAQAILSTMYGLQQSKSLIDKIRNSSQQVKKEERLFSGKFNKPLILAFLISFFNQASGISFILFYAPEILEDAGFGAANSLLSSASIGLVNLLFTIVGMYLIDRSGRKKLMYIGSFGYILSLIMVAYGFYISSPPVFQLTFLLMFIASHAIGQGAIIWVFISEIFPTSVRAYGQAWGSGVLNIFAALITLFGSVLINQFEPWAIFSFFAGLMVLQLLFTHFIMPETKGVALEDIVLD